MQELYNPLIAVQKVVISWVIESALLSAEMSFGKKLINDVISGVKIEKSMPLRTGDSKGLRVLTNWRIGECS